MNEQEIWRDAYRLYQMYSGNGLEQDAHGIFRMAYTACQTLIKHYNHPLAFRLTMALVDYYIDLWELAHNASQPGSI